MQVEKYTTNKGKDGIIVDGYKYRLDKAFKNTNALLLIYLQARVIFGFPAFCNNEFVWSLCYIIYRFAFTGLS
jgi:hypothetical protein